MPISPCLPPITLAATIWIAVSIPAFLAQLRWDWAGRRGGTGVGSRIPSRWAWTAIELTGLITFPLIYLSNGNLHVVGNVVLALWLAHYAHRALLWPWLVLDRGATVPLTMLIAGICFYLVIGNLVGWFMALEADYPDGWLADPRFVAGLGLMIAGAGINVWADYRLRRLRIDNGGQPVMPQGGVFDLVACPNLTGEIIEWAGFALLTRSMPGLAFAVWTAANLVPRAIWRRKWYRQHFSGYPRRRAALFPGVL